MTSTMTTPRFEVKANPRLMDIKWGDVVDVDFTDNSRNSEQNGIRPAIIIQNDKGNEHAPTTIVASITSQDKKPMPTHVMVKPYQSGLNKVSTIMCEQIRTIDKRRLREKIGRLDEPMMNSVNNALFISFGLEDF